MKSAESAGEANEISTRTAASSDQRASLPENVYGDDQTNQWSNRFVPTRLLLEHSTPRNRLDMFILSMRSSQLKGLCMHVKVRKADVKNKQICRLKMKNDRLEEEGQCE